MRITFSEKPELINSDIDNDVVYSTNYYLDKYILRVLHCYQGIGMSDKYDKISYIEVYLGEENVTKLLARIVGIYDFPIIATIENLKKFLG